MNEKELKVQFTTRLLLKEILGGLLMLAVFTACSSPSGKDESKSVSQQQNDTTERERWSEEQANSWYEKLPWLVGSNYTPRNAINQLEMWQSESFDTTIIDQELTWAKNLGFNTMRVYLHDLPYEQDSSGFLNRIDHFLTISAKHGIKPLLVIFDSCWDPYPKMGEQPAPQPHVHNSGWVQSPGAEALKDTSSYPRLERYVTGLVKHFAHDERIIGWDVWNEPNNPNTSSYGKKELSNKDELVLPLLKKTFEWCRKANPDQPLTSGLWDGGIWSDADSLTPIQSVQLNESDILSFHNYESPESFEKRIKELQPHNRPILCTEYMARPNGSTFKGSLPIAKRHKVAAYNWGFVDGKTQTKYAWDTWKRQYKQAPSIWFHDILQQDGTPYDEKETDLIRSLTNVNN